MNVFLQSRHVLGEIIGELSQKVRIDADARHFHACDDGNQRALECFVDGHALCRDQRRLDDAVETEHKFGTLTDITRRLRHRGRGQGQFVAAPAGNLRKVEGAKPEMGFDQFVQIMTVQTGIENIALQHDVIDSREIDPALQ